MDAFARLPHHPLEPRTRFVVPASDTPSREVPDLVHLEDPAPAVMTDFRHVRVISTTPQQSIDDALAHMKDSGVRLLLVTGERGEVVGLITAKDIQGERPVKVVQALRIPHGDVTVAMVMTPQAVIEVLDVFNVRNARVGDVLATLHALERQHALVAEIDRATRTQMLLGLFSTSQIARQLHTFLAEEVPTARSLAELVREVG